MSRNQGKIFEEQIKKSTPPYALLYRLPDSAQAFGGSSNLRFSRKNPFDYLLWDSQKHILYALELKTVAGKSITFERNEKDKSEIHLHQIDGLSKWNMYDGIICGFIIEFRKIEKTFFLDVDEFKKLADNIDKKSFNYDDLTKYKIKYTIIKQIKARTRYTYAIDDFLNKRELD